MTLSPVLKELESLQQSKGLSFVLTALARVIRRDQNAECLSRENVGAVLEWTLSAVRSAPDSFAEAALVVRSLIENSSMSRETLVATQTRLGTGDAMQQRLWLDGFTHWHRPQTFAGHLCCADMLKVAASTDLTLSFSALKALRVLLQSTPKALSSADDIRNVLRCAIDRSRANSAHLERVQLGPITKMVDRSALVRASAFGVLSDVIQRHRNSVRGVAVLNEDAFVAEFMDRVMVECVASTDNTLVQSGCRCFALLRDSGLVRCERVSKVFVAGILEQVAACQENIDSDKKEKLAMIIRLFAETRQSVMEVDGVDYVEDAWQQIESLVTKVELNPGFLQRTQSMLSNDGDIALSPSLRTSTRTDSLKNLDAANTQSADMVDVD